MNKGVKKSKKAQVTIFIIIAIVIVAGIILVLSVNSNARHFILSIFSGKDDRVIQVNDNITNCLKDSTDNALFYNGLQGGYFTTPDKSVFYRTDNLSLSRYIPYYLDKNKIIPNKEQLEKELNDAITNNIKDCLNLNNLQIDTNLTYNIDNLNVKTSLTKDVVNSLLYFPVYLDIGNKKILLDNYDFQEKTNYLLLHNVSVQLTEIQLENEDSICLSCISDIAKKNNLNISNQDAEGIVNNSRIIIYNLIKENSDKKTEFFSFAHKFYKT